MMLAAIYFSFRICIEHNWNPNRIMMISLARIEEPVVVALNQTYCNEDMVACIVN